MKKPKKTLISFDCAHWDAQKAARPYARISRFDRHRIHRFSKNKSGRKYKIKGQELIYLLPILYLSGCASGYSITYNTEPVGASVICNGTNKGYSPVTLNYSPDESSKKTGSMKTVPCSAIWSSGAKKDFINTWDLNKFPNGVIYTLQRPDVEGYSQDANFALQIQNMQYQRRQAEAAEAAASAAKKSAREAQKQNNKRTTCVTNSNVTTCY